MHKTNIILTGFMGTGKSTLGRQLASKLRYNFVDSDMLIEEQIGQTITEFFAEHGEAAFRKKEEELCTQLASQSQLVIATGGGLILNPKNVTALSKTGHIFCLTATAEEIFQRISCQEHIRPLLQGPDPLRKIKTLLQERESNYQQFPQISTTERSQEQLIRELLNRIQQTWDR